ncbi:hypothetical protein K1719_003876 [Acacia pycnantha]|nr:hypothetical protein K1719_003876 [Acacia pycnantha]
MTTGGPTELTKADDERGVRCWSALWDCGRETRKEMTQVATPERQEQLKSQVDEKRPPLNSPQYALSWFETMEALCKGEIGLRTALARTITGSSSPYKDLFS